ncbi:MAG: hypothetical protein IPJ00_21640 [Saprospirales bacterium]|nr:hypothetical protein [Saprospirales bacterium]
MKKIFNLFFCLLTLAQVALAQNDPLPRGFSHEELDWLSAINQRPAY